MVDVTGKEIKKGMCVYFDYGDGSGMGVVIDEQHGQLGFWTGFPHNEFYPLAQVVKNGVVRRFVITKE